MQPEKKHSLCHSENIHFKAIVQRAISYFCSFSSDSIHYSSDSLMVVADAIERHPYVLW